jgi:hypothetical protein
MSVYPSEMMETGFLQGEDYFRRFKNRIGESTEGMTTYTDYKALKNKIHSIHGELSTLTAQEREMYLRGNYYKTRKIIGLSGVAILLMIILHQVVQKKM